MYSSFISRFPVFILFSLCFGITAYSQGSGISSPITIGESTEIRSNFLNETRKINLYLPEGYTQQNKDSYQVIYLLDGSTNEDFLHICGLVQFFTMQMGMPKTIVAGISNVDRKRDFTFHTDDEKVIKEFPNTGHSAPFIDFIEKELKPFIEKNYSKNKNKILIGQSLGGLLASEIFLKKPTMFSEFIIVSPSIWWDNESLLKGAPDALRGHLDHKTKVSVLVGKEGKQMEENARDLALTVKAGRNKKVQVDFIPMPQEDHATILHNAVYEVFKKSYFKKTK